MKNDLADLILVDMILDILDGTMIIILIITGEIVLKMGLL
jgi:hypothetical protein